jgi:hypothetical protein
MDQVNKELEKKADKDTVEKLLDRINQIDEITKKLGGQLAAVAGEEEDEIEEEELRDDLDATGANGDVLDADALFNAAKNDGSPLSPNK